MTAEMQKDALRAMHSLLTNAVALIVDAEAQAIDYGLSDITALVRDASNSVDGVISRIDNRLDRLGGRS